MPTVTGGVRRAVLLPLVVLLAVGCGTPAAPEQPTAAPTSARWNCPVDRPGREGTPLRPGRLLPWPPRGSLAADTALLRAAGRAWRASDPEAPDPAGMRPLYAERTGHRVSVVLQGRMRDGRLVAVLLRGTRQRLAAEDAVTLHWPPIPQVSFWLPAAPLERRDDGERRLSTAEAELLVLAPDATRVGWLRSTPARPRPELVELDGGDGAWRGRLADVGEVVGLQVCAGGRLLYAGLPGRLAPGFGEDPGNELSLAGPLWILDQATSRGVRWQLAARPSVRRPTGPTVCVAVRDALNVGAEPPQVETCGVQVGRRDPLWLEGAVLHAGAGPITGAQVVAVPTASRAVFRVDGAPLTAPTRALPGYPAARLAAAALPPTWRAVEAVVYDASGRELGRAMLPSRDGLPRPDPRPPPFVRDRVPMPSCGAYTLAHRTELTAAEQAMTDCFWQALAAGRPAELSVTRTGIEGDPVTTLYRALPDRAGVEVLTDATRDSFGSGRWSRNVCVAGPPTKDLTFPGCRAG